MRGPRTQSFAATNVGVVRDHNEDSYLVDDALNLYIVADGMGGHAAGEVASAAAVQAVQREVKKEARLATITEVTPDSAGEILGVLEGAVHKACADVFDMASADPDKRGMGTTLTAVWVIGQTAFIAHVGDSRCYLTRKSRTQQITEDHTVYTQLIKKGKLSPEQVERLGPKKNALMRAVGVYERVDVDTTVIELLPGDALVLCSDGLTQYLQSEDELTLVANELDDAKAPEKLVALANARGGSDNITVIYVRIASDDPQAALRAQRLTLKRDVLAKVPIFARLTDRELLHVMQVAATRDVAAGARIIEENTPGDEFFVVLDGQVTVSRGGTALTDLGAGSTFGEMALIRSVPRSATVTAKAASVVLSIHRKAFLDILRRDPQAGIKMLWQFLGVLSERLDRTSDDLRGALANMSVSDIDELAIELE